MLFKVFSLLALSASSVLAATPTVPTTENAFNPPVSVLQSRSSYYPISQVEARGLTNAKRLAAGLPLMPPRKRHHSRAHPPKPSGTPANPECTNGHLEVRDESGDCVGHVRSTVNNFGEYGLTEKVDERLVVSIDLEAAKSGACDIKTINGPDSNLPFFGGITGYSSDCGCNNLNGNSRNYAYLGATIQTSPRNPPSHGANSFSSKTKLTRAVQSAIFKYDNATSSIAPQWINEDGSTPKTHLGYTQDSLVLAGDQNSFIQFVGDTKWVSLHFVPLP